jgi:hypothetical protein
VGSAVLRRSPSILISLLAVTLRAGLSMVLPSTSTLPSAISRSASRLEQ